MCDMTTAPITTATTHTALGMCREPHSVSLHPPPGGVLTAPEQADVVISGNEPWEAPGTSVPWPRAAETECGHRSVCLKARVPEDHVRTQWPLSEP